MASRSNTKFQKRQKEFARAEKRQEKAARKERRKAGKQTRGGGPPIEAVDPTDLGLPEVGGVGENAKGAPPVPTEAQP